MSNRHRAPAVQAVPGANPPFQHQPRANIYHQTYTPQGMQQSHILHIAFFHSLCVKMKWKDQITPHHMPKSDDFLSFFNA